jgi:hypothetical protein
MILRRVLALVLPLALAACGGMMKPKHTKESVQPLLQKEAESMKADGEKMPDNMGVKAIWHIEGIDIREQPGNDKQPFAGTVRFRIESRTNDFDGPRSTSFQKSFNYAFDAATAKWQMKP